MFEFQPKSSNSIEKAWRDKKKFELLRKIHPRDRQICLIYGDVLVLQYSSYRDLLPEKGKQVQETDKFVRPDEMFQFPSIRVIESQLQSDVCKNSQKVDYPLT